MIKGTRNLIITLFLTTALMQGQSEYVDLNINCSSGMPVIVNLTDKGSYLITQSDSTFIRYPDGGLFKIDKSVLQNEYTRDFTYTYILDDKLYLIHSGGGVVLEYDNNQISRIDQSFYHQNQYGAIDFSYDNQLFLFGGVGLFSTKNFITRYDFLTKEWYLQNTSGQAPLISNNAAGIVIGDNLYVIALPLQDSQNNIRFDNIFEVYQLDLKTWQWNTLGKLSKELSLKIDFRKHLDIGLIKDNKILVNASSMLFEINPLDNTYIAYENQYPLKQARILRSSKPDHFKIVYCDNQAKIKFQDISWSSLDEKIIQSGTLYTSDISQYYNSLLLLFVLVFGLFLVVVFINELKINPRIIIRLTGGVILYKRRQIESFSKEQVEFLIRLAMNQKMTYADLENQICLNTDSQAVRTKKREAFMESLTNKLAAIYNHTADSKVHYIMIKQDETDRRMRFFNLNKEYFKVM